MSQPRSVAWREPWWLIAAVIILIIGIIAVTYLAFHDRWDSNRVNAFAAWATGLLTLAGVGLALFEAHRARVQADANAIEQQASEVRQRENADRQRWEIERERRVDLEIRQRTIGMEHCVEILDALVELLTAHADIVRKATTSWSDHAARQPLVLDAHALWLRTEPYVGARALLIARSGFARELANRTMPALERAFDVDNLRPLEDVNATADQVIGLINQAAAAFDGEALRARALEDFSLDMDSISADVAVTWPPFVPTPAPTT